MQIHEATAKFLGKKMKDGIYEARADEKINLHQHTQILMQLQIDIRARHQIQIDYYRNHINELEKLLQHEKETH